MARLIFTKGPCAPRELQLNEQGTVFGRDEEVDFPIDDPQISGRHAQITRVGDQWKITDLKSSNGTVVNGQLIDESVLREGYTIELGTAVATFKSDTPQADVAAMAAESKPMAGILGASIAAPNDMKVLVKIARKTKSVRSELAKAVIDCDDELLQFLMCLACGGHALLSGPPGSGKTLLARVIAQTLGMTFSSVRLSPDSRPSDLVSTEPAHDGTSGLNAFGPIFSNFLLVRNVDGCSPEVQNLLFQAMQERHVTVAGQVFRLPDPFFVMAALSDGDRKDLLPLTPAQCDGFLVTIHVDYPAKEEEKKILGGAVTGKMDDVQCVLQREDIVQLAEIVAKTKLADPVVDFATDLLRSTRPDEPDAPSACKNCVELGVGTRGGMALVQAAKAFALLDGRLQTSKEDITIVAPPVLRHRIRLKPDVGDTTSDDVISALLEARGAAEKPAADGKKITFKKKKRA